MQEQVPTIPSSTPPPLIARVSLTALLWLIHFVARIVSVVHDNWWPWIRTFGSQPSLSRAHTEILRKELVPKHLALLFPGHYPDLNRLARLVLDAVSCRIETITIFEPTGMLEHLEISKRTRQTY